MKSYLGLVLGSLLLIAPGTASAQFPAQRPAVSPYLNLLQGGQSAGVNYYGIVRPELEFRSNIQRLQQQTQANQQAVTDVQSTILPATGHFAGFMTQGTYFQSLTGGAAGASFATTGAPTRGAPTNPRPAGAK